MKLSLALACVLAAFVGVGACSAPAEESGGSDASALTAAPLARAYQGTIGNLSVMARFEVAAGGNVTGSYFYVGRVTKGEEITLKGTLSGAHLTLTESVLGKKTGSFDGTIADGSLKGAWRRPDGTHKLDFNMFKIFPGSAFTVEHKISDSVPAVEASGIQKTCDLDGTYLEVFGMDDAVVEGVINASLRLAPIEKNPAGQCQDASSDNSSQSVKFQAQNVLVVESVDSWFGGGAHPLNGMGWKNISLTTGRIYTAKDVFKPEAKDAIKDLVLKGIAARADLDDETRSFLADDAQSLFDQKDWLETLDFFATADGIRISLFNWLAHAIQGVDESGTLLTWRDVKPLLVADTEIATLSPVK